MRTRIALRLTAALVVVAASIGLGAPAQAVGTDPVQSGSSQIFDLVATDSQPVPLPYTSLSLPMTAGEEIYLYTKNLHGRVITTGLPQFPDPGIAFYIRCYGPGLPLVGSSTPSGWFAARNADVPSETNVPLSPHIRGILKAPQTGTYNCQIWVAAYEPDPGVGPDITVRYAAGASLHGTPIKSGSVVTTGEAHFTPSVPTQSEPSIAPGGTFNTLGTTYTFADPTRQYVTVVLDQHTTTCTNSDGPRYPDCYGTSSIGSTISTHIRVQPKQSDGVTNCGTLFTSTPNQVFVKTAWHHTTFGNVLTFNKSALSGCPKARIWLRVSTTSSSSPVIVHATWAVGSAAARGSIYEH